MIERIPLAVHIRQSLESSSGGRATSNEFLEMLEGVLDEAEAQRVLATVIEWGRYAELFAFDDSAGELSLENPSAEA